jgi:hypothetical protein
VPYGVRAAFEPGDLVLKDAGVLLGDVVTVERRGGITFVGLDIGWNVNCAYFIYRYAQEIVPVVGPLRERPQLVTVAGHINEAGDVFAEDYFPRRPKVRWRSSTPAYTPGDVDDALPVPSAVPCTWSGAGDDRVRGLVEVPGGRLWGRTRGRGDGSLVHAGSRTHGCGPAGALAARMCAA